MQPSEERHVCDHPVHRVSPSTSFSSLGRTLLGALCLLVLDFGLVRADATANQASPDQYGTPLVHLLGAGVQDSSAPLQEDPVVLSSLDNRIYPLSTDVPATSVDNVENSLPIAGFGALPLCLERGTLEGDCAASQAPEKATDSASEILLQGFQGPQQAVFLDVALHQAVPASMLQDDVPLFSVTSGTISSAVLRNTTANLRLVSLEVELDSEGCMLEASSGPDVPECSFTLQVSSPALSNILPATLTQAAGTANGSAVWSQMLRVRLSPQIEAPKGWPEVSFERQGDYHMDVVTFHFDTAVVPVLRFEGTPAGNPSNLLQIEGEFEEAVVLQYTDPVPSEDTGIPLQSTMRVIVARECKSGDVLRVVLPKAAAQDLAGNTLSEAITAESTCIEQPLRELPHASRYLKALGVCLAALVVFGLCATGWLLWQALGSEGSMGHGTAAPAAVALATVALLLQGQRIALYMLPLLCQGSGCDASTVVSLQWTLLGAVTSDPTHPVSLSPISKSFPSLAGSSPLQSNSSGLVGDVSHVSMYLVAAEERSDGSVGACDPSGMLCGHRWLGNATVTSLSTGIQSFVSTNLQPAGILLNPSDPSDLSDGHMLAAETVAHNFDAASTGVKASSWRVAMGALALFALLAAAASVAICAWRSHKQYLQRQQLRLPASPSASAEKDVNVEEQDAVARLSPEENVAVCATQWQWLWRHLRAAMHVFAALAPVATIAAAVGVSAAGAAQGVAGGGVAIAILTAVAFAALLSMLAVFYITSGRAGTLGRSFSDGWGGSGSAAHGSAHGGTAPRFTRGDHRDLGNGAPGGQLTGPARAIDATEVSVSRPHSNQKSGASDAVEDDSFAVHPAPAPASGTGAAGGAYPAQKPSRKGLVAAAARAGRALTMRRGLRGGDGQDGAGNSITAAVKADTADLERFCEPCGGELVTVQVGDFGGGAVLDASELVAPPDGLQVRTNMGPAMKSAEVLTAANLKFVQLLRDKRLPPQPHAMALRAANIIALSSEVIRSNTSEGEICHASLKALQVLLERTTPSANSLIRRLPPEVPPHGHIVLLVDYINNPEALHPANAFRNWHNPHAPAADSQQFSNMIPGGQSGMSGDLRTSEVLFALDSASGPAPVGAFSVQNSDGAATLSDHNTMTDSVALSVAVPPTHMPGARISASQIPENVEIWTDDPPVLSASSLPMMVSNAYGNHFKAGPLNGAMGGQLHWRPPSLGPSSAASISTHTPVPTSIGPSTTQSGNVRAASADGSTGNPKELLRPPLSSETNESRAPVHSGRMSLGDPVFGFPVDPGSFAPGSGSTYGATGCGQPPQGPYSMGPLGTPTDGPSSLQLSQRQASSGHSNLAVATAKAAGSSSTTAAAGSTSAAASVIANAGSFTTQASGTMAPQSGQSNPAAPPNLSSFMPSTNDTWKGLLPSTQGSTLPAGPVSDISVPHPSSGALYSAGSLQGAVAETPQSSANNNFNFVTANEALHTTRTSHNSGSLSGTPLRSSGLSEGGHPSTYTRETQDTRHTVQSHSETPRQRRTPRTPDTLASPIPSTGRYSQSTPRTIFETAASSMYRNTGDHQSAVLVAEQLDTIAKSTDVALACEPDTPRASAVDQRTANSSHVDPPSPMYPNSATSSNLYAVVTPAGQLTARTNDSSATPRPAGPSTARSWPGVALHSPQRAATAFETELAAKELLDQYAYYQESPSAGARTHRATPVSDNGTQKWLMLSTEFDTPHGLAGRSPGSFGGHSHGGESSTSPQSSAHGSSTRGGHPQHGAHFHHLLRSPRQKSFTAGLPQGPRSAPRPGARSGPRSWAHSGARSGPGSYPDAFMLQQLREEFQITDTYDVPHHGPVSAARPNTLSFATSPAAHYEWPGYGGVVPGSGSQGGAPEHESLDSARPRIGARQLSTIGGSGSPSDQNERTITLSASLQIPVEDVSRQNSGRTGPNYWSDAVPEASLMHMNHQEPSYSDGGLKPDGSPMDPHEALSNNTTTTATGGAGYPEPCFPTPQSSGDSRGLLLFPKVSTSRDLTNASTHHDQTSPDCAAMRSHSLNSQGGTTQKTRPMSIASRVPRNDQEGASGAGMQRSGLSVVQARSQGPSAFAEAPSGTTESYSIAETTEKLPAEGQKGVVAPGGVVVRQYGAAVQSQTIPQSQDEFEVQRELTAAAALLQPTEVAGNSLEGDASDDAHRFSWWTLEYIGNSRDSSTPQHHLGTLNSAAAASAATETMSEDAFSALQWQRGGSSPWWAAREVDTARTTRRAAEQHPGVAHQQSLTARTQDSFDPALHAGTLLSAEHPMSESRGVDSAGAANALDTCQSSVQNDGEHALQTLGSATTNTTATAAPSQQLYLTDAAKTIRTAGVTSVQVGRATASESRTSRSALRGKQFTPSQYSTESSSSYTHLEVSRDKRTASAIQNPNTVAEESVDNAPASSMLSSVGDTPVHSTPRDQASPHERPATAKQFYTSAASASSAAAAAALRAGYMRGTRSHTPRSPMHPPPHYTASLSSIDSKGTFARTPRIPEDATHPWQMTQASQNSMALSDLTSVGGLSPSAYAAAKDYQMTSARQEHIAAVAAHQQHNIPSARSQSSLSTLPSQPYNSHARSLHSGEDLDESHNKISAALQKFRMTHMGFPFLRETPQAGTESLPDSSIVRGSVDSDPSTRYSWSAHDSLGANMQSPTWLSNASIVRGQPQRQSGARDGDGGVQGGYAGLQSPHSGDQHAQQTAENYAMQLRRAAASSISGSGAISGGIVGGRSQIPAAASLQRAQASAGTPQTAAGASGSSAAAAQVAAATVSPARGPGQHQRPSALPSAPAQPSPQQPDREVARAYVTGRSALTGIQRRQKQPQSRREDDHLEAASAEVEGARTSSQIKPRRVGTGGVTDNAHTRSKDPSASASQLPTGSKRSSRKRQPQPVVESRTVARRTTTGVRALRQLQLVRNSEHMEVQGPAADEFRGSTGSTAARSVPIGESREPRRESLLSNASSLSHDGTSAARPRGNPPSSITDSVPRPESSHYALDASQTPRHSFASSDRSPYNNYLAEGYNTEPHSGMLDSAGAAPTQGYRPTHGYHASGGLRSSYQGARSSSMHSYVVVDPRNRVHGYNYPQSTSVTQSPVTQERSAYPTCTTRTSGPLSSASEQQYGELQQHTSAGLPFVQTPTGTTLPPATPLSQHGATIALVADAVRTVWLAFILPVLSIQPILRYSLAFAAILLSAVVTLVATRGPRSPYQLGLLLEGISVVVAAAWLLSSGGGDSEPWCGNEGCLAPIIALWTLMLVLYGLYLVFVMIQCFSRSSSELLVTSGKGALLLTNGEASNSANGDASGSIQKHSPRLANHKNPNNDHDHDHDHPHRETSPASIASSSRSNSSRACMPVAHSHVSQGRSGTTGTPLSHSGYMHGSDAPVSGYQSAPGGSFHASSMHGTEFLLTQTPPSSEHRDSMHHSPAQPPVDTTDTAQATSAPTSMPASTENHNNDLEADGASCGQDKQAMNTIVSSTAGASASLRFNSLLRAQQQSGGSRRPVSSATNAPSSTGGFEPRSGSDVPAYVPPSVWSTQDSVARATNIVDRENESSAAPAAAQQAQVSKQGSMLSTESTVGALMLPVAPLGGAQALGQGTIGDLSGLGQKASSLQESTKLDEPEGPSASASANASGRISESGMASADPGGSAITSLGSKSRHASKHLYPNPAANPAPPGTGAGFSRLPSDSISLVGLTMQSAPSGASQSPSTLAHGAHSGSLAFSTALSALRASVKDNRDRLSGSKQSQAGKLTTAPSASQAAAPPRPPSGPPNPTTSSNPSTASPSPRDKAPVASEMHEPQASEADASKFSLANSEDLFTIPFPKEVEPAQAPSPKK